MIEHGRGSIRLEYGRRLFSNTASNRQVGDFTLKVCIHLLLLI